MAETRYDDQRSDAQRTTESVEAEFEVELAGLNDNEIAQVKDAISEAEFNNELDGLDVGAELQQAQFAEEDRAAAEELREEQVEAADAGAYGEARERAEQAQDALRESSDAHGGQLDTALAENEHDVEVLSEAEFQQDSAEYFEDAAVDYAELDSDAGTEASLDDAYDAADAADTAAENSTDFDDTGGDQSIYTDAG